MATTDVTETDAAAVQADFEAFIELVGRTCKEEPDQKDIRALQDALSAHPEYWTTLGQLAHSVQESIIKRSSGLVPVQESLRTGIQVFEKELGLAEAPLLEGFLIREVIICWLDLYDVRGVCVRATTDRHTRENGLYWDRRVSAAQRRFVRAIEALARVRKLASRRPIQINIAEQQVNMAG